MPYYRRRTTSYRRPYRRYTSRQQQLSTKTVAKIAKREIRKEDMKDHPLQWADLKFTGGDVNTTPTMHSLVDLVRDQIESTSDYNNWARHLRLGETVLQANYRISYIRIQLRFQQDTDNIESSNTFRTVLYSFVDTLSENNGAIFGGTDIDSPPDTEKVKSMFFDKMGTLRAGTYDPSSTDEADPTPGTRIVKYSRRMNHNIVFTKIGSTTTQWDTGDLRWEAQSDTIGSGLQLYGFIRVYYRRLV